MPEAEEYLKNGIESSGVHVALVHFFFLLGHGITEETVELIDSKPAIISSTGTILRLWDDLGSAKVGPPPYRCTLQLINEDNVCIAYLQSIWQPQEIRKYLKEESIEK